MWKTHYHEISIPSINKYTWINLQLELHKRKNDKVIKANLSKNMWMRKCAFHLSVVKIWASSWKLNQVSNKEWGIWLVIGVQCKMVINEHILKHRVSVNKVNGCVEPRKKDESPREKAWETHWVKNIIQGDMTKVIQPILKLTPIYEHSQLETKKRECWIRTMTTKSLKALRCTHV